MTIHDEGADQFIKRAIATYGGTFGQLEIFVQNRNAQNEKSNTGNFAESPHNGAMDTVGRQELDAKLAAAEARMDARVARIEGMISNIAQSQAEARREIEFMRTESRQDNKSTRTTIIVTAVSAVLAIVGGVAAFNATVLSNMVASFESGKNTAASLADAAGRLEKVQAASDGKQRPTPNK